MTGPTIIEERMYKGYRLALIDSGDANMPLLPCVFVGDGDCILCMTDFLPDNPTPGGAYAFALRHRDEAWTVALRIADGLASRQ